MTRLRTVVVSSCAVALIAGCQKAAPDERANGTLNITSADPDQGIEAKYAEQGHTLVLRSKSDGAAIQSELIDERGHDVVKLASGILDHTAARTVTVNGLFENVQTLRAALQLARHGIRQLGETLPADAAGSPAFTHLSKQAGRLRRALGQTRLALLQAWGSQARSQINMTPDEHAKFFAILNRQAQSIMAAANGPRRGPAAAAAAAPGETSPDTEIAALLGPERYAQYQTQRKAFFAPAGDQQLEVVP